MRQTGSALISAVWLLLSMLILCVFVRLLYSFRHRKCCLLPATDDVLVVTICLIALASMVAMSTTVTGAATADNAPRAVETSDIQIISYASTILLVLALNLSKLPLIVWLKRLKLSKVYRMSTIATGCIILAGMLSMTTSVIFQCQLPKPWDIRLGECTPSHPLWTTMIAIDIAIDVSLVALPTVAVMSLGIQQRNESWAAFILCLRTFLIIPSLIRLVYLQQPIRKNYNFTLESLPYAITTQCQVTIAAMLSCTPALPYLANLVECPSTNALLTLKKHWSGSSFDSEIANGYFASAPTPVIKEPLPCIQASMTTSMSSCQNAVGPLPVFNSGRLGKAKAPLRPPPPSEHERPDLRMFTRRPTVIRPPPVTSLYTSPEERRNDKISRDQGDEVEIVKKSKHVKFDV